MACGSRDVRRDIVEPGETAQTLSGKAFRAWSEFAAEPGPSPASGDAEVDAALEEFGGDFRATIRALLHDLAVLAGDFAAVVSRGYVRGMASEGGLRVTGGKRTGTED